MDARTAFKFGFISRCIEAGLTDPEQIFDTVKSANPVSDLIGYTAAGEAAKGIAEIPKAIGEVGSTALNWAIPAALAAPPILGYLGGNLAGRAMNADDFNADDAKQQELVDEYHRQTQRMNRQGLLNRHQARTVPRRPFF